MIKTIIFLLILIPGVSLSAQNTIKLTGTIIGTTESFDYSRNTWSFSVNTTKKSFDVNLNTIFSKSHRNAGWAGLDLGEKHIITRVAFCPRESQPGRMMLGVFEGANSPDFGDAVPLHIIDSEPSVNRLTNSEIRCSRGFRYVRYVGPNDAKCNLAELEFYGYRGEGDDTVLPQPTNLPAVVIHTTDAQDIVDKEVYVKGIISLIYDNGAGIYTDSVEIRGRGNASWSFPKKPYRIKLNRKTNLLGMPAREKSWTLINNYGDKSLMRNLLAFDLSKRMELAYTPAGKSVDVFLNGEYKGTYQLCDHIEEATGRVEIDKMAATDIALPTLSGGYFIEVDAYAYQESSWFSSARNSIPVTIKYPKDDEIVPEQRIYIKSHFDKLERAVYASNFTNPADGYRKYLDTGSFLRHFLVGEISGNTDTYWSTFMYKKRNNDLFYVGPVWDFDLAYENDSRTYPVNSKNEWVYQFGSTANGMRDFVNRILSDPQLLNELKQLYAGYRDSGIISHSALLAVVDEYEEELNQSQRLNFLRWKILNSRVHMNPLALGSFSAEVNQVRNYIINRIAWMDTKLSYVPNATVDEKVRSRYIWVQDGVLHLENIGKRDRFTIYDISGRLIVAVNQAPTTYTITLSKGVYIIQLLTADGKQLNEKVLVN